jgi:hypothetical protein
MKDMMISRDFLNKSLKMHVERLEIVLNTIKKVNEYNEIMNDIKIYNLCIFFLNSIPECKYAKYEDVV